MPYNRLFNSTNFAPTGHITGNVDTDYQNLFPRVITPGIDFDFGKNLYKLGTETYSSLASIPGYTFTRALQGLAQTSYGTWTTFASNVPRVTDRGVLIEDARTNSFRNNSMVGSTVGVLGSGGVVPTNWVITFNGGGAGVTAAILAKGTEYGLPYIDIRCYGTPTAVSEGLLIRPDSGITASNGQTWTASYFARFLAGTSANQAISFVETGGAASGGEITVTIDNSFKRHWGARTNTQVGTNAIRADLRLNMTQNVAVDFTVRVYAPQLELGAYPTSPIITSGTALTRPADVLTFSGLASYLANTITATVEADRDYVGISGESAARLLSIYDTSQNKYDIAQYINSRIFSVFCYSNNLLGPVVGTSAPTTLKNIASASLGPRLRLVVNGGTTEIQTMQVSPIIKPHTMSIGSTLGAASYNGYITKLSIFSQIVTDAELVSLTKPVIYG